MLIQIIENPLNLDICGYSGFAINKDYAGTAFKLMDNMWKAVIAYGLKNKGMNIWVYGPEESVFAGVELTEIPSKDAALEYKRISLERYAYFKHIGPYSLIKKSGQICRMNYKAEALKPFCPISKSMDIGQTMNPNWRRNF